MYLHTMILSSSHFAALALHLRIWHWGPFLFNFA